MITSLIEMLQLSNFGHMITSKIQFESRDIMDRKYDAITFILKYVYFKKA